MLVISSEGEEAPMEIYQSYKDNKHPNVYEPIKTIDIIRNSCPDLSK